MRTVSNATATAVFAVVACACGVLLGGCHAVSFGSNPFGGREPQPSPPDVFSVDWRVKLVGPQLWESSPREPAEPAVDPDTGRVVVLTRDGRVRSVNPEGGVEWEFKTQDPFLAGARVRDGIAYVPGGDGVLYALRMRDGSLVWKYDAGEQLATVPLVAEDRVFVASHANALFAVERETGKWLWQYRRDMPTGFMVHGASAPALSMGVLYIGFADGFVAALDPETGAAKWEKALSSVGNEFLDVDTTPIVDDAGRVIVASYKDGIFALDQETGAVQWNTETPGITGTLQRGQVIFATGDELVGAVHSETGKTLWSLRLAEKAAQPPAFARGLLVIPLNSALMFVDPGTGSPRVSWDPGQGVTARPVWADQHLYVLSNTGYLYALRLNGSGG